MGSILDRVLGREPRSALQAKERMKLVLIHDRTDISATKLAILKDELIGVIAKHVDIDPKTVKIEMTQDGRIQRLIADIPIQSMQRSRRG